MNYVIAILGMWCISQLSFSAEHRWQFTPDNKECRRQQAHLLTTLSHNSFQPHKYCYYLLNFPIITADSMFDKIRSFDNLPKTSPLIKACLSQNSEHIKKVIEDPLFDEKEKKCGSWRKSEKRILSGNINYAVSITLDFDNIENFYLLLSNAIIKKQMQDSCFPLQFAIFCGNVSMLKNLIQLNIFNLNNQYKEKLSGWFHFTYDYNKKYTLLDMIELHEYALRQCIGNHCFEGMHKILIDNDAQRSGFIHTFNQLINGIVSAYLGD